MTHAEMQKKIVRRIACFAGDASLVAWNLNSGERFDWQEERIVNPASTIKLPILCAAYYWAERGELDLDRRLCLKKSDFVPGNGVLCEFAEGLNLTLRDAMHLMIVISDNTATNLVIETVGLERIKAFLAAKGLAEMVVGRKMFDTVSEKAGINNYLNARTLALVLQGLENRTLLAPHFCDEALDILLRQQCNNKIPAKIVERWDLAFAESAIKIAHKTGEMPSIEHDAGIIYLPSSEKFVLVVLTENGKNEDAVELISDLALDFTMYFQR